MTEPAAKEGDEIISDGSGKVWVQPSGSTNPITVAFRYKGLLQSNLSPDVLIMGKLAATVGSHALNSEPPDQQEVVTLQGKLLTENINNTGTITAGCATVAINDKMAARNGDSATTWDYSTPPSPGTGREIPNATVKASSSVLIGE